MKKKIAHQQASVKSPIIAIGSMNDAGTREDVALST